MKVSGILILAALVAAVIFGREQLHKYLSTAGDTPKCLVLVGSTTTEEDGHPMITGSLRNDCTCKYGYVQVSFKVHSGTEGAGDLIVTASKRDIAAGETWEFQTAPMWSLRNGYQFDRITAF